MALAKGISPVIRATVDTVRVGSLSPAHRRIPQSLRCLHCGHPSYATPINHPTVPGPAPHPPTAPADRQNNAVARKHQLAELVKQGRTLRVDPARPSSALRRRFWQDVSVREVDNGLQVMLDSRPVRTSTKQVLTLPKSKRALAAAIAFEWDALTSAQQALKQHYVPLTALVSRALDIAAADAAGNATPRNDIVRMAMRYLSTDTLLCWAPERSLHDPDEQTTGSETPRPQSLRQRQVALAEPVVAHLTTHVFPGVEISPVLDSDSIVPRAQAEVTQQVIRGWITGLPAFELAALERATLASKSLLVATRLIVEWSQEFAHIRRDDPDAPRFGIAQAAEASSAEITWQTDMWGEVEDTHDVDKEDMARQLGSAILLVS